MATLNNHNFIASLSFSVCYHLQAHCLSNCFVYNVSLFSKFSYGNVFVFLNLLINLQLWLTIESSSKLINAGGIRIIFSTVCISIFIVATLRCTFSFLFSQLGFLFFFVDFLNKILFAFVCMLAINVILTYSYVH